MTFHHPWALLLLVPALGAVAWVARHARRTVPRRQFQVATIVRAVGVALLVTAVAGPVWAVPSNRKAVLFLVDRSASITAEARARQEAYLQAASRAAGPQDLVGVAVFGEEVRMDTALGLPRDLGRIDTVVDADGTDLAAALRAAAAVLPTEGSRRVVVLTDAVETRGDARTEARALAEQGIAVDVVVLPTGRSTDALVSSVDAPVTAREGDVVPVEVVVDSTATGPATVTVTAGGTSVDVEVDLVPGRNRVTVEVPAVESGVLEVDATVSAGFDTVPQNDMGQALVRVLGPPRVLVVEGKTGEGDELADALEAGGIGVDRRGAIPGADELLRYDAVVLVDVPAPPDETAADLASFVEDLGRGLVVVGGDRAYGLGGYQETALEEILPVTSDPDDLIRRQPVAEVLVIDTSGSMADCHCGSGFGDHDPSQQGGVNKTDISRAGAALAIGALQPEDRVGILAFTSGSRWALPLDKKPSPDVIDAALRSLTPAGDTDISQALRTALEELRNAPEEIKHMVLFTDGWGDDPELLSIAQEIADAGITLSVLGTGEGTGETLRRVAALGNGRFYPGRDLEAIPEIFVEETLRVARPLVAEGAFLPALAAASPVTAGLTAAPPLRGYVLTTPKPTAAVVLEIGPGDPLLATWQRGLGRATAWMSDATRRWSADWVTWEGFTDFWGKVVRDVMSPERDAPPEVRLVDGAIDIRYDVDAPLDAVAVARIRDGAGNVTTVPMQRVGEEGFTARLPIAESGAYWVAVTVENADGVLVQSGSGVVAGYPEEFAFREPDAQLPVDLASSTGGRVDPAPIEAFAPVPRRGAVPTDLWPWLTAAALVLFLVDVALRRLVLDRGDLRRWRAALRPAREPVAPLPVGTPPAPGGDTEPPPEREIHPEEETLGRLLRRKRGGPGG